KRTLGVPFLEAFDFASPDKAASTRTTTTVAPQALILLNSAFMEEQSAAFADRLLRDGGSGPESLVGRAFRLALQRPPTDSERGLALGYLSRARAAAGPAPPGVSRQALAGLCKLLLNLNEFVYLD